MMGNSFIFGYNIGVLNQPVMVSLSHYSILTISALIMNAVWSLLGNMLMIQYTNQTTCDYAEKVNDSGLVKRLMLT